ncbi:BfmA/BtgA family mobilization protein [Ascidiimonas sp. W6]|uniref:BfmA/BtgA family mobilization protein n=1 Tax=Ascidiimonas meishanensis TaxID=3128903 RepID=UPI0030EECF08
MNKKGKYQYNYKSLLLEGETVHLFRKFCKQLQQKQSHVLHEMIHFFQWHGISPLDRFGPQLQCEEEKTRKRIDAVIAIIKDIEKSQTKPTTAMLQSLFQGLVTTPAQQTEAEQQPINPRKSMPDPEDYIPKIQYDRLQEEKEYYQKELQKLLEKVVTVKPTLGSPYLKLQLSQGELIRIQRTLKTIK